MRVYIASRYQLPESVEIYEKLLEKKIDVFLPKTINLDAKTSEERNRVYNICTKKIRDDCDVILVVYPFGLSVASEFGMTAMLKILGYQKKIILLNLSDEERRNDCTCYRQGFYRYRYIDTVSRKISD